MCSYYFISARNVCMSMLCVYIHYFKSSNFVLRNDKTNLTCSFTYIFTCVYTNTNNISAILVIVNHNQKDSGLFF